MPFCRYCGQEIRETDKFCFKCGKSVNEYPIHTEHKEENIEIVEKKPIPEENEVKNSDGTGIALGLISFISSFFFLFPVSIICGAITFPKKRSGVAKGFGVAGFVIGILEILFLLGIFILFLIDPKNYHFYS